MKYLKAIFDVIKVYFLFASAMVFFIFVLVTLPYITDRVMEIKSDESKYVPFIYLIFSFIWLLIFLVKIGYYASIIIKKSQLTGGMLFLLTGMLGFSVSFYSINIKWWYGLLSCLGLYLIAGIILIAFERKYKKKKVVENEKTD